MQGHVCNVPSRYRMSLCARIVRDGERHCWQHRGTARSAIVAWFDGDEKRETE